MKERRCCLRIVLIYIVLLISAIIFFTSCVTYERCVDKYGVYPVDSIQTPIAIKVPVYIQVPPDSAKLQAALDSLLAGRVIQTNGIVKDGKDSIKVKDSTNLSIKLWFDKNTKTVNVEAKQKSFPIYDTIPYYDTIPVAAPPMLVKPLTWKDKAKILYQDVAGWAFPFTTTFCIMVIRAWARRRYFDRE